MTAIVSNIDFTLFIKRKWKENGKKRTRRKKKKQDFCYYFFIRAYVIRVSLYVVNRALSTNFSLDSGLSFLSEKKKKKRVNADG